MPLVAMLLATLPAAAYDYGPYYYDYEENGIYYKYILSAAEDEYTLGVVTANLAKASVYLVIPDSVYIEDIPYKVSTICDMAFKNKGITSISASVDSIGKYAFYDSSLLRFNLPNVVSIGAHAFESCPLSKIELNGHNPKHVSTIGKGAFKFCSKLESISTSFETIADSAFYYCSKLTDINTPKTTSIGRKAFSCCNAITELHFENLDSIYINVSAFSSCTNLKSISFKNINALNAGKFDNAYDAYRGALIASGITAPGINNIKRLYGPIFYKRDGLTSWELNTYFNKLEVIGDYVFYGCPGLTELNLPNVISIGEKAFSECTNLKNIYLPKTNIIGVRAFENCTALDLSLNYNRISLQNVSIVNASAFSGCTNISFVYLPNIRRIAGHAFYECNFQQLHLGEELEDIEISAFKTCTMLREIESLNMAPPTIYKFTFPDDVSNITLYVPKGSAQQYRTADFWKKFRTIREYTPKMQIDKELTIEAGASVKINARIYPKDLDTTPIRWSSKNNSIATVSSKGIVTGIAEGQTQISAKRGETSGYCRVTVKKTESIEDVKADVATEYDVYNLQGIMVRGKCDKADIYDLPTGIYILVSPQGRTKVRI